MDPVDKQFDSQLRNPGEAQDDDDGEPLSGRKKPLKEMKKTKRGKTRRHGVGSHTQASGDVVDADTVEDRELSALKQNDRSQTSDGRMKKSKKRKKAVHVDG